MSKGSTVSLALQIKEIVSSIHPATVGFRRHLHANPELSFEEHATSAFVRAELDRLGISHEPSADTGVVGIVKGDKPSSQVIALRADLDALPIQEVEGRSYGSRVPGVMHACGHDAHTASLLSVANILKKMQPHFGGTVKLIFQPGEERLPGGASLMIKEGVLENPRPSAVIGQHVMPFIPTGKVGFREGKYMASTDELYITVRGKGGHGAQPHQNIDPVLITAHIIVALQQVVSRIADPKMPSVLSIGYLEAQGATNIIPDEVHMKGTFRTFDEVWRKAAHQQMVKIATGIADSMGGQCDFEVRVGYPAVINEEKLTASARRYAAEYLGEENIVDLDLWMGGEDFAYYSQLTNACFYRLGTGNPEKDTMRPVHTPAFDIDEDALEIGAGLMAYIALRQLQTNEHIQNI